MAFSGACQTWGEDNVDSFLLNRIYYKEMFILVFFMEFRLAFCFWKLYFKDLFLFHTYFLFTVLFFSSPSMTSNFFHLLSLKER